MSPPAADAPGGQATSGDAPRTWDRPLWQSLLPLGRSDVTGGYRRYSFTDADRACRDWFLSAAADRGLRTETDRNGNLWAWWDPAGQPTESSAGPRDGSDSPGDDTAAIVTGSHLDSVPDGGAFDGPLGVVSAFAAAQTTAR